MTLDDVASAVAMYRAGGWGERERFLRTVLSVSSCRLLVGTVDGELVATGMATINGPVGWIGSIFTKPECRSRGYGRAMTQAACDIIAAAGCRTAALIASDYGKPLYDTMGFRVDAEYEIYAGPKAGAAEAGAPEAGAAAAAGRVICRPMRAGDLAGALELDRLATGEDRSTLISALAHEGWVAEARGALRGYLVSIRPDSGALIAEDREAAAALLERLRANAAPGEPVHAALVSGHQMGRSLLADLGWRPAFRTPRMLRGDPIDWRPEMIWSVLGFAFG